MEFSYKDMIDKTIGHWQLTQSPAPLASPEVGVRGWSCQFQPSTQALVFLVTSPDSAATLGGPSHQSSP